MDTLQKMRVLVRVVEAGSFTGAAQHLNTTTAYASRAVSDLEARLRTRLLNRTTRRIALTDAFRPRLAICSMLRPTAHACGGRMTLCSSSRKA